MSLGDIPTTNAAAVDVVSLNASDAQIEHSRQQALAEQSTVRAEATQVDTAPNEEAKVYGGLISELILPGAKALMTAVEGVSERLSDTTAGAVSPARSIESDISLAGRTPGLHNAPVHSVAYGGNPKTAKDLSGNSLVEKTNIARMSLREPESVGVHNPDPRGTKEAGDWKVDKKLEGMEFAKKLITQKHIASELALNAAHTAGHHRAAALGMVRQMAPGMMMNFAPRNTDELLSEARRQSDESQRV